MYFIQKLSILIALSCISVAVGVTIDCEFSHHGSQWGPLYNPYRCVANPQIIVDSTEEVKKISGNHEALNTNVNVTVIDLYQIKVDYFPKNFDIFFPNVEGISAATCGIKTLDKDDLKVFPKLIYLNMDKNQIQVLHSDLFDGNPNLNEIRFDYNNIKSIGRNLLKSLTMLKEIYFFGNNCTDERAVTKEQIEDLEKNLVAQCANETEVTQTQSTVSTDNFIISELRAELIKKNDEIDKLTSAKIESEDHVAELNMKIVSIVESHEGEIATLNETIQNLQIELETKNQKLKSSEDSNILLSMKNEKLKFVIEELKAKFESWLNLSLV